MPHSEPAALESPLQEDSNITPIDLQLAVTFLEQVALPPICINWPTGFQFLVYTFKPEQLFSQRIRSFRYIPQDVRPLFRECYIAVLTVLDAQSPTAAFLHQRVISFLTAFPALLVQVPGLGPNGVLDAIKKNFQFFLEAKWSHLHHSALNLHARDTTLSTR